MIPKLLYWGSAAAITSRSTWTASFKPRLMMPLSLSFDHRIVDGADGARFLRWIVAAIEQPLLLAMEG